MYMVISTPKKKTFIIKFPSKLKKSWPTLNIGVPIIEYIDLLDEPKKKKKVIIGTSLITVLIPTSPLHLSFPFPKGKLKFDHTIKQKSTGTYFSENELNVKYN
jgi:hypothetical protein